MTTATAVAATVAIAIHLTVAVIVIVVVVATLLGRCVDIAATTTIKMGCSLFPLDHFFCIVFLIGTATTRVIF